MALVAAVAMEYPELSLADVIGQMHDNAMHDEAAELWGAAARYRKPLVPLLQALRDADRAWEITAILRRTIGAGDIPGYKAQQNFGTRYHRAHNSADRVGEVFAELLAAGMAAEADALHHLYLTTIGPLIAPFGY